MKRIIITGSRHWPKDQRGWQALIDTVFQVSPGGCLQWPPPGQGPRMCLIYGDCPTGIDNLVHRWGGQMRTTPNAITGQCYTADWGRLGRAAGPDRNARMVASGADLCLAYPHGDTSRGTLDCLTRAVAAGIPCRVTELVDDDLWRTRDVDQDILARLTARYR